MNNLRNGFAHILLILVIAIITAFAAYYFIKAEPTFRDAGHVWSTPTPSSSTTDTSDWKTYKAGTLYSFKYPPDLYARAIPDKIHQTGFYSDENNTNLVITLDSNRNIEADFEGHGYFDEDGGGKVKGENITTFTLDGREAKKGVLVASTLDGKGKTISETREYVIAIPIYSLNKDITIISAEENKSLINSIVTTFKFLSPLPDDAYFKVPIPSYYYDVFTSVPDEESEPENREVICDTNGTSKHVIFPGNYYGVPPGSVLSFDSIEQEMVGLNWTSSPFTFANIQCSTMSSAGPMMGSLDGWVRIYNNKIRVVNFIRTKDNDRRIFISHIRSEKEFLKLLNE